MIQPTQIPGIFSLPAEPLKRGSWYPRYWRGYGLYVYGSSYRQFRDAIRQVGWGNLRVGGDPTGQDMGMLKEDQLGYSVHVADGAPRDAYGTDEEFLAAAERRTELRMARYQEAKAVHVWNEPNGAYMLAHGTQRAKADLYAKLLIRVSRVVRWVRPGTMIIGFDTARASQQAMQFFTDVYTSEAAREVHASYDICALHPGIDPAAPEGEVGTHLEAPSSIARLVEHVRLLWRNVPERVGRRKPIWFTEGGWHISQEDGGLYAEDPLRTVPPVLQAAYLVRYYALAIRLGVQCVTPFFVVDADQANGGVFDGKTGAWRMAATAIQTMIRMLPAPRLLEPVIDGTDGVYVWMLDPGTKGEVEVMHAGWDDRPPVYMAWAVMGPRQVSLEFDTPAVVTDMLGERHQSLPFAGRHALEVGPCPIYVRGGSL